MPNSTANIRTYKRTYLHAFACMYVCMHIYTGIHTSVYTDIPQACQLVKPFIKKYRTLEILEGENIGKFVAN